MILVGITIYRVVGVLDRHADQQFRSLLASLEILAATAVSNAIVLGSFVRDRGEKKRRFRFGSNAGASSLDRPPATPKKTITNMEWGSDTDLVSGLGMRCSPSLTERRQSEMTPRPAPIALPTAEQANRLTPGVVGKDWQRPREGSASNMNIDLEKSHQPVSDYHPEAPTTPRDGMSFFDVGGLLIHNTDTPRSPRLQQSPSIRPTSSRNFSYPSPMPSPRTTTDLSHTSQPPPATNPASNRGSHALIQDMDGLLMDDDQQHQYSRAYSDSPRTNSPEENNSRRDMSLADVLREEGSPLNGHVSPPVSFPAPHATSAAETPLQPRYEPLQQGRRAQRELLDVGGLLG